LPTFVKLLVALLISILIFAGFFYLVNVELLEFVEAHFYNPSVVNSYVKENTVDAELIQNYINYLQNKFETTLTEPAVRSSFLYNQSSEDIFERSKIYGILMESTGGLQSVQFVDSNGIRLHYSTSSHDVMSQNQNSTAYRNYNENPQVMPYEIVSVQDGGYAKLTMDEQNDRIIFSFPFKDSLDVYHGTALFSISVRTLAEKLIAEGRLKTSDNISVIKEPSGILLGSPETSKTAILRRVSEIWSGGVKSYVTLDAEDSGMVFSLITFKTNRDIFFGRLVSNHLFSVSGPMKLILKVSILLTFFLVFFFMLNLKPNSVTIVKNRLTRLRESLFKQLYADKSAQERTKWILELEQRRDEIKLQLKRNIRLKSRQGTIVNSVIDKSWDEMLVFLKIGSGQDFTVVQQVNRASAVKGIEELKETGKVEGIEEIDEVEAIGEVEKIEELGEVEAIEEIDEVEGVEELGEIEEIDEIEEIEEIEEAEEIGEVEKIKATVEAKEIEETKEIEKVEETNVIDIALREAMEADELQHRGLFWHASKFAGKKPVFSTSKGLLNLASKKISKKTVLAGKGLLALASEHEKSVVIQGRGLLAHAAKIEDKSAVDEIQSIIADIDVVSPFSEMFSTLK
jgi:hypothetical protein